MKNIIEYEVYRYSLRLGECYDEKGRLSLYPVRRPMQCMVLKRIADSLSADIGYSKSSVSKLIEHKLSFDGVDTILKGLMEYGFLVRDEKSGLYYRDADYEKHYLDFLGLF